MSEHVILVAGPMGAGKTTSIASLSDGSLMVSTEATNNDRTQADKATTTVAMEYSEIILSEDEKVRIYGLPGQKRFAFMWELLKKRAKGMILLVNNDAPEPVQQMLNFLEDFNDLYTRGAIVIGITKTDIQATPGVADYATALNEAYPNLVIPIFTVDPRDQMHMRKLLMSLVANLEVVAELAAQDEETARQAGDHR